MEQTEDQERQHFTQEINILPHYKDNFAKKPSILFLFPSKGCEVISVVALLHSVTSHSTPT